MAEQADQQMGGIESADKGKGKAPQQTMEESTDNDSSDEESATEAEVEAEPEDEDNMEEIDTNNIVQGRTRGKQIDYAAANKNLPEEDDDDEDDDDFKAPEGDDAMEE